MLQDERDAFGPEALNLQEFDRGGREFLQQQIAALAGAMIDDLVQHHRQPFADARDVGDFAGRVGEDIGDTLRIAFHRGGAVAIAADAKPILGGDLHQVRRLPQHARDFLVLQFRPPSIQL